MPDKVRCETWEPKLINRLLRHCVVSESGCWERQGCDVGKGKYRQIWKSGRMTTAHRVSWECFNGLIPEGMEVCHTCDNGKCINPFHLFLGTHTDNMKDAVSKHRISHGETHPKAKLTTQDVIDIRMLRSRGNSLRSIASQYGVESSTVHRITTGEMRRLG